MLQDWQQRAMKMGKEKLYPTLSMVWRMPFSIWYFSLSPKMWRYWKKEKHSYYIHHLYKILVLLTNKAELIKNVLFLKYISWLLHVSLSISFTQSMCHIYGHQLIRYLLLVISPVRDVSLLPNLHNYWASCFSEYLYKGHIKITT